MTTTCVIQARMGSLRLPGKVLADIHGEPLLGVMLDRLATLATDELVVASSTSPADDAVETYCLGRSVAVVRGSEVDVLSRFVEAVDRYPADTVVRLTADCPLVDPEVVRGAVCVHDAADADYTSNTLVRTYPDGLDVEVMTCAALRRAAAEATSAIEREHVTPYLYRHPEWFRLAVLRSDRLAGEERWTVDTADDLAFVRHLAAITPNLPSAGWLDLLERAGRRRSSPTSRLSLRPAIAADMATLLEWRNDPITVEFSASGAPVQECEHQRWFISALRCPAARIWIAQVDEEPVGQVRVDVTGGVGVVDVAVAPSRRCRGHGGEIVAALLTALTADYQITRLRAMVHEGNSASLRLFAGNGFRSVGNVGNLVALELER